MRRDLQHASLAQELNKDPRARVVAAHGRHDLVLMPNGQLLNCVTRGRKGGIACGDFVNATQTGDASGVIDSIAKRSTEFMRSDGLRTKVLAANIDQVWGVVAGTPPFSDELVSRAAIEAERQSLPVTLILNKADLKGPTDIARERLAPFAKLGYRIEEVSLKTEPERAKERLLPMLADRTTLLFGESGMGKSSLLNLLVPNANARTRDISLALNSGRHTTTDARLYNLTDQAGVMIDTPGFQEFGLNHLSAGQIERAFAEMKPFLGQCRFYNCTHLVEPGCAIREAVTKGEISAARYQLFCDLTRQSMRSAHLP